MLVLLRQCSILLHAALWCICGDVSLHNLLCFLATMTICLLLGALSFSVLDRIPWFAQCVETSQGLCQFHLHGALRPAVPSVCLPFPMGEQEVGTQRTLLSRNSLYHHPEDFLPPPTTRHLLQACFQRYLVLWIPPSSEVLGSMSVFFCPGLRFSGLRSYFSSGAQFIHSLPPFLYSSQEITSESVCKVLVL